MSRQKEFLIYCVETYKNAKHLSGKQMVELFTRLWNYVYSCFEALRTTGANYIEEDINLYIEARKFVKYNLSWFRANWSRLSKRKTQLYCLLAIIICSPRHPSVTGFIH